MRTWLHFDTMVTPKIITFIYWLMLAAAAFTGITLLFKGFGTMRYSGFAGLGMVVCAPIVAVFIALMETWPAVARYVGIEVSDTGSPPEIELDKPDETHPPVLPPLPPVS